ncbi:hypothetical protein BLNAU_24089 [Blattamonas nauphoetae]|uniref:Uncharacterized protein n=1 Tax=Blattamonas nauphoetae TaxID=2049346 RepID=A0ABQ9WND7_9EUKA|nr:hypothetical protein BLNAU_24089 [Blattamonas nauphoetae]
MDLKNIWCVLTDGWESDLQSTHADHCCSGAGGFTKPAHPHLRTSKVRRQRIRRSLPLPHVIFLTSLHVVWKLQHVESIQAGASGMLPQKFCRRTQFLLVIIGLPVHIPLPSCFLATHMDNGNVNVVFDYASPSPEVVNGLSDWMIGQISIS